MRKSRKRTFPHRSSIVKSQQNRIELVTRPGENLQLFKFREMFEKRFHDSIGVSDLYKMKELVTVADESEGRMVSLNKLAATAGVGGSSGHDFSMLSTGREHYSIPAANNLLDNNLHTTYAAGM